MPTEVILPKVDMDMATGQISRWFYKEGDAIRKGEPLFEIETDKAAMEVDAPASGTLRNVTGAEGVDIAVGSAVAWIYAEGEQPAEAPAAGTAKPERVGPDPDVEVDSGPVTPDIVRAATSGNGAASNGALEAGAFAGTASCERRPVRATPLARRLAREFGLDLVGLKGRGPSGRIQREDVEEAAAKPAALPLTSRGEAPAPQTPAAKPAAPPARRPAATASSDACAPLHAAWLREGQGTPIVLIHGFASELASWRPLLSELGTGAPVLGIDLAGHGGSVDAEAADFAALVAGVEETLGAYGIASCHLVGHSLGGAVATAVAAGLSTTPLSLLLIAPAGFGPDIDTNFTEGFSRATDEAPVRSWLRHLVADPSVLTDGFVRATAKARADGRQAAAQVALAPRLFSNGAQHFEVRGLVDALAMPVKIVAGTEDRVVPVRHFTGLPGRVALHLFARTGHMPQIEQRTEIARLVRELTR